MISTRALLVFRRNWLVFKKTWLTNITFNFFEPLLYLAAMGGGLGMYVRDIGGVPYINWLAPGLIASTAMWATASECTWDTFVRMDYQKTFHAIIATPVSLDEVTTGEMLFGAFKSVLYGSVILGLLALLGLVASLWALLIPLVLGLCGAAFAELAMTWTGLIRNINQFNYFFSLVVTPMFLFSGVFFPLEGMPVAVHAVAWMTPLYHVVNLIRSLTLGQVHAGLWLNALWLAVFVVAWFFIPVRLIRRRMIN